jgi:hypothetical protein
VTSRSAELGLELEQHLAGDLQDDVGRERLEHDDAVEAVAELGAEGAVEGGLGVADLVALFVEAHAALGELGGAGVAGHDEDDVAKVGLAAGGVGEGRVVHDLEEDREQVGVGLLDLVEDDDGVRRLGDGVGEQAALVEADVAGRGADEAADGVLLHVLGHVEAEQRDGEQLGEGLGELGLADAGRAGEQERADRLVGAREAGAGPLDRGGDGGDGLVLAEHEVGEALLEVLQDVAVRGRDRLGRDAGHAGDDGLDGGGVDLIGAGAESAGSAVVAGRPGRRRVRARAAGRRGGRRRRSRR